MAFVSFELNDELLDKVKQKLPDVREWPHEYYQVDMCNPIFTQKSLYVPRDNKTKCSLFVTITFRKVTTSVGVKWELIREEQSKELNK